MHAHEEREREENTNVSSAFERKTTSAKEKREQRDAKKFREIARREQNRIQFSPSLLNFCKEEEGEERKKRNETRAPGATKRARFPTRARKMQSSPKRRRQRVNF